MRVTSSGCLCLNLLAVVTWFTPARAAEPPRPATPEAGKPANPLPARVTDAVTAKLPRYVPPWLPPVKPAASPGLPGGSDSLDEIFHLPDITVITAKPLTVARFDFLTPKERLELALKNHPGLRLGPLASLNNAVAVEMQKEEREAAKRDALKEQVQAIAGGDEARSKELIRLMKAATARPNTDWLTKPAGVK